MPSRAEVQPVRGAPVTAASVPSLRVINALLHAVALICLALLALKLFTPARAQTIGAHVSRDGSLDRTIVELLRAPGDTLDVELTGVPSARTRAALRAVRGSGHACGWPRPRRFLHSPCPPSRNGGEWRHACGGRFGGYDAPGGTDGAGLIDSLRIDSAGLRTRSGPLSGAMQVGAAAAAPLS